MFPNQLGGVYFSSVKVSAIGSQSVLKMRESIMGIRGNAAGEMEQGHWEEEQVSRSPRGSQLPDWKAHLGFKRLIHIISD